MSAPCIAMTMGDPAGVGPEIILKALDVLQPRLDAGTLSLAVVGTRRCFEDAAHRLGRRYDAPSSGDLTGRRALVHVEAAETPGPVAPGLVSAEAGRLAYHAIERAVRLAMDRTVDAIVTAPINKEALNLAGYHYSGHTELLADLTGSRDSVMMLAHGPLRVSHVSTHIALEDVPSRLTAARLGRVVELTVDALRRLGIVSPRIAVAALNPHAGEGGIFGRQDLDVTRPLVEALRAGGLAIEGPVPGDTVFVKLRAQQYDAVVAMYHDQGHIPVKLLGFSVDPATGTWNALSGVNVTLGLPIIRTSVDHGTAFDIAGRGSASETSLLEATDYAVQLAAGSRAGG